MTTNTTRIHNFKNLSPERRREIARMGGLSHNTLEKYYFKEGCSKAQELGRKGGLTRAANALKKAQEARSLEAVAP